MLMSEIGLQFSFLVESLCGFDISNCNLIKKFGNVLSVSTMWNTLKSIPLALLGSSGRILH